MVVAMPDVDVNKILDKLLSIYQEYHPDEDNPLCFAEVSLLAKAITSQRCTIETRQTVEAPNGQRLTSPNKADDHPQNTAIQDSSESSVATLLDLVNETIAQQAPSHINTLSLTFVGSNMGTMVNHDGGGDTNSNMSMVRADGKKIDLLINESRTDVANATKAC